MYVSAAFVAKTPPLHCVSAAFVAKTPPLPCGYQVLVVQDGIFGALLALLSVVDAGAPTLEDVGNGIETGGLAVAGMLAAAVVRPCRTLAFHCLFMPSTAFSCRLLR